MVRTNKTRRRSCCRLAVPQSRWECRQYSVRLITRKSYTKCSKRGLSVKRGNGTPQSRSLRF